MKKMSRFARMMLYPVGGPGPTLLVGAMLIIALDVGYYYAWYVVVGIALLIFFLLRLLCWSLVTGITVVLYLFDEMALHSRPKPTMRQWWMSRQENS